jgi:hypothetical protein
LQRNVQRLRLTRFQQEIEVSIEKSWGDNAELVCAGGESWNAETASAVGCGGSDVFFRRFQFQVCVRNAGALRIGNASIERRLRKGNPGE